MRPITRRAVVIVATPRRAGVVLVSRRHIDLRRLASALCPR
ncbi:hypothetical protein OG792_15370 [Micromonospora sp. NBC_01699]|nr:putative leader peptide [Micromonospora sp. NBC_01699]